MKWKLLGLHRGSLRKKKEVQKHYFQLLKVTTLLNLDTVKEIVYFNFKKHLASHDGLGG